MPYVFNPFTGNFDAVSAGLEPQDDGVTEGTSQEILDFVGAGVSIAVVANKTTVTIPGGGGGGSLDDALAAIAAIG